MSKNILICGGAGTLGSGLSKLFIDKGHNVSVLDIVRFDEAWKLDDAGVKDKVEYIWKSTADINEHDLKDIDVVIDCGLAVADRPQGISSPIHTVMGNVLPPLYLLETVRRMDKKPTLVYASSFNARYGHPVNTLLDETTFPLPSTQYGWTKGAVELLYMTYNKGFNIPTVVVVVGSGYGPRMRSDELVGHYILSILQNKSKFQMRSPDAKRLWSYAGDILGFYEKLIDKIENFSGKVLSCAGNKGDQIVSNMELSRIINRIAEKHGYKPLDVIPQEYEPGELIDGKPIDFRVDASKTRKMLGWEPKFTLEEGLDATMEWFSRNIDKFGSNGSIKKTSKGKDILRT